MSGVNLVTLTAGVLFAGLVMYAISAGADFGSGIWAALASGPRARQQRESLLEAIGPIWETNHVWLIFVVVTLFTAFPAGFSALFIALLIPFVIALVGINFRGAAFAFRHFGRQSPVRLPATLEVFSISSLLTPFTMGMALTATAAGRISYSNGQVQAGLFSSWITPFTIMGGLVGMAICAYLTPIYMAARTQGDLQADFGRRGLAASLALGGLTGLAVPVAMLDTPDFFGRLITPIPLIFVGLAVLFGVITLLLLWRRFFVVAQFSAAATVAATLAGFGLALYPYLLIGQLTFQQAAAPVETIQAYLIALPFGALILVPSLLLLYGVFRGNPLEG